MVAEKKIKGEEWGLSIISVNAKTAFIHHFFAK